MHKITPILLEWNVYNGFNLEILSIEFYFNNCSFDGSLFGLSISKEFVLIDFLFMGIEIISPIQK